jgi:hypothetical protein
MLVGAFHFPTNYGIKIGELARALEVRGAALIAHHEKTSNDGVLANEVKAA